MTNKKKTDAKDLLKKVNKSSSSIKKSVSDESAVHQSSIRNFKSSKKHGLYLSFNARIVINLILLVMSMAALYYFETMSFSITKSEVIKYTEKSKIDYKVYLKDNDFYKTPYLNKGMAYVSSLIDTIDIKYDYKFEVSRESNLDINHKIMARIVISSQNNDKIFYEDEYELANEVTEEILDKKDYILSESVSIDYGYYNNLANKFKSNFSVSTDSYLEVYLQVDEKSKEKNEYDLNNQSKTILRIPLSLQELNIGLEENTVNNQKQVSSDSSFIIISIEYIVIDFVLLILIVVFAVKLLKKISSMKKKLSKYDRYINKIFRGYDRVIVNIKTAPNLDNYNIIKVESFEELLDLRDSTREPIRYFEIMPHQKSEFFLTNHDDLYIYTVKAVDLEDNH